MIGIVDYGAGNLRSVQKALQMHHGDTRVVRTAEEFKLCDKLVLPGVGAFGKAMQALDDMALVQPLRDFIVSGKPFLGICLGMQLLFESSEESPGVRGLGMMPGTVIKLPATVKAPHLGWNQVQHRNTVVLLKDVPQSMFFYFAHSFYAAPAKSDLIAATCRYGVEFAVAIEHDAVFLVQFHPEKSQKWGLKIIENFVHYNKGETC
ncbi:imidazole glycerol phosphate synthase subunit HisH [candidate division KSB1 bacterium]|nr:imidazole glycerol phosphate synthase subunit HisH [candidate division KSB1 bacterium]